MPTTTSNSRQDSLTQYNPSQLQNEYYGGLMGAGMQLIFPGGNFALAPQYGGPLTAPTSPLQEAYWGHAQGQNLPDYSGYQSGLGSLGGQMLSGVRDPNAINFQTNYDPHQFNVPQFSMSDPFAGYQGGGQGMQVQAPSGIGTRASDYQVNVDQVSAPAGVQYDRISGLPQISAPTLQQYQMGPAERVTAPGGLNSFQLNAPGQVQAGTVSTQSFTQPGTAASYMSPYTQNVLDVQKAQAQRDYDEQISGLHSQAAKAGAFGGSRQAVVDAEANRDLQNRMAQIQATGEQQAFQQAQQQFNQEQQLGLQGQQFNQQTGLQAGLANQQAGLQTSLANQQAALAAQGLGTTTGMQAALANQQAGLATSGQNLQALLGTQALGAQLGMQGQLANQQMSYQQQLANQQAGLQAGMFNNQQLMQAQQLNQAANLQAGLAAQQMGLQGATTAGQFGMQAQLANQQAQQNQYNRMLQGLQTQYGGNLQSGLQGQQLGMTAQQLGMQSDQFGANLGLQSQQAQEAARAAAQNANLGYYGLGSQMNQQGANYLTQGYQNDLARTQMMGAAAQTQGAYDQAAADRAYQYWQQQQQYPFQLLQWGSQMAGAMPQQGSVQTTTTGNQTQTTPGPSPWNIAAGLLGAGVSGLASGFGGGLGKGLFGS